MSFLSASLRICGLVFALSTVVSAQIPAPKDSLGFTPGDDRKLVEDAVAAFERFRATLG